MSVDGQSGSVGQGGGRRKSGVPRDSVPAQAEDPAEGSAPQQPDGCEDGGILPPERAAALSDSDLTDRLRAGDDTAYEELYRRHAQAVRRYAGTCCRDSHTADDLTAEVFARMLQAVHGGHGPEHAVRAYLLTSVRRVAADWSRTAKREQLVDDFAVFAAQALRTRGAATGDTLDLGADVRTLHAAEQSLAMRAFQSLPERWQAVLWHTEVEDESPSEVATLFGLDANGTRVLASRAREGLKQAYLQAHVSTLLATDEGCARYADLLGAYARGRLRTRAERDLRGHLAECVRCRLAAGQVKEIASGIPAVVPVAVIGWFGAGGYAKAVGLIAGGAGVAGAASGSSGGVSGGAAASEGLGAPARAGIAAGVIAVAAAAVALALIGDDSPAEQPDAKPSASAPVVETTEPRPADPEPNPPVFVAAPSPTPSPTPTRSPSPSPTPTPTPTGQPTPTVTSTSPPAPTAPAPPAVYRWSTLSHDVSGDGTDPEMRIRESSWVWQRYGVPIADKRYAHGVTVAGRSSVTIDLNRACTAYTASVGIDDMTLGEGKVYFSVHADGVRLWESTLVEGGDPAVPVHVDIAGRKTVRLVVEPDGPSDALLPADWAESKFTCV